MHDDAHAARPLPAAPQLPRGRQWLLIGAVAGGILLLALLLGGLRALTAPREAQAAAPPPGTVVLTPSQLEQITLAPATFGDPGQSLAATGVISVDQNRSTPVILPFPAQVARVFVDAGQEVRRGQPLFTLESVSVVDARNALLTAQAQVATANAQLATAEATAKRQKELFETAGGAEKDYRQAQSDLVAAQSARRAAAAALAAARNKLALFGAGAGQGGGALVYRAPASGTIAQRNVAPGQYVDSAQDTALMTIADLSRVWLVAQVPEAQAPLIRVGDTVRVTTPAFPGREFSAVIDNVAAALDPASRRLAVRASVANPDRALKPQMSASFSIRPRASASATVVVPAAAVIYEGDDARVWVQRRGGVFAARGVKVGESAGGMTRILAGLKPGERIVTGGALFVNEAGLGE
ncbi:MAG: hypothetical protein A4S12_12150 [Proteobacteria bacterium SG_bin5]|nr:MAG: hypothetical protein A4S12_12150 [Proteobacteria bacterium SG_bin5]